MPHPLAIVIPAYRSRHLGAALDSLALQTDRRFQLYIGDDASPDDLASVIETRHRHLPPHTYRRFPENLGGSNLTAHWHRCISLTQNEPWIWLFSDDDLAQPDCVADFYRALETPPHTDLYHFNIDIINEAGAVYERPAPHPDYESAQAHATALLSDRVRQWRAPDHIFSRRIYDQTGGFVSFPRALYSDFATWIKFSHPRGVRTIGPSRVHWRSHDQGTSSGQREKNRAPLTAALCEYMRWATQFETQAPGTIPLGKLPLYAYLELALYNPPLSAAERRAIAPTLASAFGTSRLRQHLALALVSLKGQLRDTPFFHQLAVLRYRYHQRRSAQRIQASKSTP